MAGTQLFFDILARDHASATFNKVGAAAATLGKRTDQAGKSHQAFGRIVRWTGGMLSAYGVATYLKSSVQEYAKAEAAQNRLGNSYQRFPKMQNATLASFKELNKQLMLHTQFDDDDAAAMQANLGRFDLTGKQIQKLTPLVADLAQVQGTDLVTAGSAMGKAFLGNTRALKALGINYTSTGNRAKDYRNIVELLNKKVGGESTKANQTAAVKLKQLENQWGELKETVGAAVLPAFNKLVQVAGPAVTSLGDAVQRNMPQIKQTFEDVYGAAKRFGGALKGIWDGFSSMPEPVRNVLLAMAGGTWALGKIKGSALGSGISGLFSGIKTITAGNVTVVGKTVTGTPGAAGKGGAPGWLAAGGLGTVALGTAISAAIVMAIKAGIDAKYGDTVQGNKNRQRDIRSTTLGRGSARGDGMDYKPISPRALGSYRDFAAAQKRINTEAARWKAVASAYADQQFIKNDQKRSLDAQADRYKALAKAVKDVPANKKVNVTDGGSAEKSERRVKDLGGSIGALRGKRVPVEERGADQSRGRVRNLKGEIGGLKGKRVDVSVGYAQAVAAIAQVTTALAQVQSKTIYLNVVRQESGSKGAASGGYISGPGTATSDSIPAWLSNGEYVIRAAAVDRYGVGMLHQINAMAYAKGGSAKKSKELQKELNQARAEANRQRQIAAKVEQLGLGATAISYLGGLSSKAALKALERPKQLRRAAGRAASLSDLQARRDAARQKTLDDQQAAADAQAEAAEAAEEAARREADAQQAVRDAIEETASSYRSFASIASVSLEDASAATEKLTSAQEAVTEARNKMDLAGNDRDRAAAALELANAEKALTAAQTARNNVSDKLTSGSIRAGMSGKLSRLRDFASAVRQLKANGMNATTLADILAMGPDQGYDFAKALLDGGLADINDLQNQITAESASLGLFTSGVNSASATAIGQANAAAGGLNVSLVPAPVTLNLDGAAIAQALLVYQRQSGR